MAAYLIAEIKVTNECWIEEYSKNVHAIVHKHGGRYLSRGGKLTHLEGIKSDPTFMALLEFPSTSAIKMFMSDPEYMPYKHARSEGSISHFKMLEGNDATHILPYLEWQY